MHLYLGCLLFDMLMPNLRVKQGGFDVRDDFMEDVKERRSGKEARSTLV